MGIVPNGWFDYTNSARIPGTRFVACKVPLREEISARIQHDMRFTPKDLLKEYPDIKLVVDLTYTTSYYNGEREFTRKGVRHVKIWCKGQTIPTEDNFNMFLKAVDETLRENSRSGLIVVHCTHGLNRTGYFICRFMVERMGFSPRNAFRVFESSRGHQIERTNYKMDIIRRFRQIMPDEDIRTTFKRCRSAINLNDPTLRKIAYEINLAEMLLLQYLKEISSSRRLRGSSTQTAALDRLSCLVLKELEYLRKVKASEVVDVTGNFATFRSDDGEFLVTVVPEEELQRNFHPLFCFNDIKPRFAKPVSSCHSMAGPCPSAESVYYDAWGEIPSEAPEVPQVPELPPGTSSFGKSICSLLNFIFSSTIGRLENNERRTG